MYCDSTLLLLSLTLPVLNRHTFASYALNIKDLHENVLRMIYSSFSFPSRFVIGRSRGEAAAERRKEELNGYVWHLIHAAAQVAEVRRNGLMFTCHIIEFNIFM